jgi:PKD repeat protein
MRKLILTLFFALSLLGVYALNGFEVNFNQPDNNTYELTFELGAYNLSDVTIGGTAYTKIDFGGSVYTQLEGFAELPYINATVQLPADKNMGLKVVAGDYTDYVLNHPMLPSRGVIYRNQDPTTIPYVISPSSMRNEWYPQTLAQETTPFIIRDLRGATIYIYPFRYNAVTQTLRVYQSVTVELIEDDSPAINPLPVQPTKISREMNGIYQSLFINYNPLADDLTIGEMGDILVLCTNRDEAAMAPYVDWKLEKGYDVYTQTVATGTNVKTIIQDAYADNNEILYVLLVGDWADIKSDLLSGYAPMDPQLGCVVGTDQVPDITIGRFSGNSADHITIQVNKTIEYEKNPDLSGTWYEGALGIGSAEGSGIGDDGEVDKDHIQVIWDDKLDPFTYEDYYTAYDPGGNSTQVNNAISSGVSIINYCGHGSQTSWGTTGYSNNNINSLSNGNMLPLIFSVACVNGAFHESGDCFAEAWLKKTDGGAVMTMMATINQPWQPPMRGQDYFNDILIGGYDYAAHPGQNGISTTEQRTTIGAITFNGLVLMTTESGGTSDWETAKTWHIFGDPSLQPRTATPGDLTLSSTVILAGAPFATTITGPEGPVEGAMVCLSQEGEYYKAITDVSGSISIDHSLTPGTAKLVVTAFNMETIYEEITVVPPGGAYIVVNNTEVDDSDGNNNGQADYGETVLLNVAAENVGTETASAVEATLSTTDEFITITDGTYTFGDIGAGNIVNGMGAFEIEIAQSTPDMHIAMFEVEFSDGSESLWISTLSVTLHAAVMEMGSYTINDASGNNNGMIDPGETVNILLEVMNTGSSDAYNIMAELSTTDPFVTIDMGSQTFGDINAGETVDQPFTLTASPTTPAGHLTDFDLLITGDLSVSAEATFTEVIGQIPVLVIDLDGNNNSAQEMMDALAFTEIAAEYSAAIPADLSLYTSVFLCLGIYSDNHVLTSAEGQQLADYLNTGGNLYMEGGDTWYYDTQTAVHSMFSVNATSDGGSDLSTVNGQPGTFTEGMTFSYSGDNSWIDHIDPAGSAFMIFQNASPNYGTGVAYDEGSYKTIAASHEFGGLVDGSSPSTKEELMQAYLEFFGFDNTLQALFSSDLTEICEGDIVEFYDMSVGGAISWEWTFEGGMPGSSSYQNPQVMYSSAGTYDVTLTVSDGVDSHSVTFEDYITVNICTDIEEKNIEKISIYPNPNIGIFTVEFGNVLSDNVTIKVLNTLGKTVYSETGVSVNSGLKRTIDLSTEYKGMYFLVIENYQGSTVNRIIIR